MCDSVYGPGVELVSQNMYDLNVRDQRAVSANAHDYSSPQLTHWIKGTICSSFRVQCPCCPCPGGAVASALLREMARRVAACNVQLKICGYCLS